MLKNGLHLVNLQDWLPWLGMADVEHPKYLLKSVPWENSSEERDLARPGRLPVVLQLWKVDEPHVHHDRKEAVEIANGHWLPLGESRPWCELPLSF